LLICVSAGGRSGAARAERGGARTGKNECQDGTCGTQQFAASTQSRYEPQSSLLTILAGAPTVDRIFVMGFPPACVWRTNGRRLCRQLYEQRLRPDFAAFGAYFN
jgi:hypothetical protein